MNNWERVRIEIKDGGILSTEQVNGLPIEWRMEESDNSSEKVLCKLEVSRVVKRVRLIIFIKKGKEVSRRLFDGRELWVDVELKNFEDHWVVYVLYRNEHPAFAFVFTKEESELFEKSGVWGIKFMSHDNDVTYEFVEGDQYRTQIRTDGLICEPDNGVTISYSDSGKMAALSCRKIIQGNYALITEGNQWILYDSDMESAMKKIARLAKLLEHGIITMNTQNDGLLLQL